MPVRLVSKIALYRSLEAAAAAGLPTTRAAEILLEIGAPDSLLPESVFFRLVEAKLGCKAPDFTASRATLADLAARLREGAPFSDCFARHPREFPPWEIAVLRVGENTGRLDLAFAELAGLLDGRRRFFLDLAARSAAPLLIQSLIPWILCAPLAYLWGSLAYLGAASLGFVALSPAGLLSRQNAPEFDPRRLPGFSKMLFCRCLAGLIEAGAASDEALRRAAEAAGFSAHQAGAFGEPIHVRLRGYGDLSSEELACLRISEECGKLDEGLTALAKDARRQWEGALSIFESAAR